MKKHFRALCIVLVICMVMSSLPFSAMAAPLSGTCGSNVTWTLQNGTLTISGTGDMDDYTVYTDASSPWDKQKDSIKSVIVQTGVTSIGAYAFSNCYSLTSISIPYGVKSFGQCAFSGCQRLAEIKIPDSVETIGPYAFSWCLALTSLTIPSSTTYIEDMLFLDCEKLSSITIPHSVMRIGAAVFSGCSNLKEIYYSGCEEDWRNIKNESDDESIRFVTIHFNDESSYTKTTFTDVPISNWAYNSIEQAVVRGYVNGVGNGLYLPDNEINTVQFLTMLVRAFFGREIDESASNSAQWWMPYFAVAEEHGLLNGVAGAALPEKSINRFDMAELIYNVMNCSGIKQPSDAEKSVIRMSIADYDLIPENYRNAVETMYVLGCLKGTDAKGTFNGYTNMTRAQAAVTLIRLDDLCGLDIVKAVDLSNPGKIGICEWIPLGDYKCTLHLEPSSCVWTGEQDERAYGFIIESEDEIDAALESVIGESPKTVEFFSYTALQTLDNYCMNEGLKASKGISCDRYYLKPKDTGGRYGELRFELHYDAGNVVRQYREGIISDLPQYVDYGGAEFMDRFADYKPLYEATGEIERRYYLSSTSSEYDKVYAIYNYLTSNFSYDYDMYNASSHLLFYKNITWPQEINYMLTNRKGVCENYAMTFQALCHAFGIDCYYVRGIGGSLLPDYGSNEAPRNGPHAWNIVCVDGKWYQVDATWDAGESPNQYEYFLVSDSQMIKDHFKYNNIYPDCPSNYQP